jgi:hypothetical protein
MEIFGINFKIKPVSLSKGLLSARASDQFDATTFHMDEPVRAEILNQLNLAIKQAV